MRIALASIVFTLALLGCEGKDQVAGTINEEPQRLAEQIESRVQSYSCEELLNLRQFPQLIKGKDGKSYLASLSLVYEEDTSPNHKEKYSPRLTIDVSESAGGHGSVGWTLECSGAKRHR